MTGPQQDTDIGPTLLSNVSIKSLEKSGKSKERCRRGTGDQGEVEERLTHVKAKQIGQITSSSKPFMKGCINTTCLTPSLVILSGLPSSLEAATIILKRF